MMWYRDLVSFKVCQNSLDYKKRWFGRLAFKYGEKERETEIRGITQSKCLQWILVSSGLMKSPIFLYYSLLAFCFQSIKKTHLVTYISKRGEQTERCNRKAAHTASKYKISKLFSMSKRSDSLSPLRRYFVHTLLQ